MLRLQISASHPLPQMTIYYSRNVVHPDILLLKSSGNKGYSYKADVFSLGSVCFNLLTRLYLFSGAEKEQIMMKNIDCNVDHAINYLKDKVSPQCLDLL